MLYGNQEPTYRACPEYSDTYGGKAVDILRLAGIDLLPWQKGLLADWLAYDGCDWVNSSAGASVQRQNGKTYSVAGRIAAGMLLFAEWCVYTSHLQKTSTETFETLRDIFEHPKLRKHVKEVRAALGREEIVLTNGARCKFLARTRNGGRGQHGDLWVVDEAQELSDEQQGSFLPLLAASKRPQTIYIGTPPDENAPGEVFSRLRDNARSGKASRSCWSEWAVDEIGDVSDRERWARTNPSMGYVIKESTILGELEQMAPDRFARERLGWWSKQTLSAVISAKDWERCATDAPPSDGLITYAVKFSPDGSTGTLAVCLKPEDGAPHVEVVDSRNLHGGTSWLADWLAPRSKGAAQIVVDGRSNSQTLVDELLRRGLGKAVLIVPKAAEMADACADLLNAVREGSVTHYDQPALNDSALRSTRRSIGSGGGWGFAANDCDPTLIESCALALWAANKTKRRPGRKARISF